jgi:hypothetical protein
MTVINFRNCDINIPISTLRFVNCYLRQRCVSLEERITNSSELIPIRTNVHDTGAIPTDVNSQQMKTEYTILHEISSRLGIVLCKTSMPKLPLVLRISNYINERIDALNKQCDNDLKELEELICHYDVIKSAMIPFIPAMKTIDLPVILIEADYTKDTSIYIKIYDYLNNNLCLIENDITVYHGYILAYEKCFGNYREDELLRWKKPLFKSYQEQEKIRELIDYFQLVFGTTSNPTSYHFMGERDYIAVTFFQNLDSYISEKIDDILNKLDNLRRHHGNDQWQIRTLNKQLGKFTEFIEEVGPACKAVMKCPKI